MRDGVIGSRDGGLPFGVEQGGARPRLRREPAGMGLVKPDEGAQAGEQAGEGLVATASARTGTG